MEYIQSGGGGGGGSSLPFLFISFLFPLPLGPLLQPIRLSQFLPSLGSNYMIATKKDLLFQKRARQLPMGKTYLNFLPIGIPIYLYLTTQNVPVPYLNVQGKNEVFG